jgi:hypothetical protein
MTFFVTVYQKQNHVRILLDGDFKVCQLGSNPVLLDIENICKWQSNFLYPGKIDIDQKPLIVCSVTVCQWHDVHLIAKDKDV